MSCDLGKVIRFGRKIGAEVAILEDGQLLNYYKPGDASSKHCCMTFTFHNNGRPLRWESAQEYSWKRIIDFNTKVMNRNIEIIEIGKDDAEPGSSDDS